MLPYLAQGANSSIEDGAVMGTVLSHLTSKSQLPQALAMYQSLRKQRGENIVRETFKQVGGEYRLGRVVNNVADMNNRCLAPRLPYGGRSGAGCTRRALPRSAG